ncbi:carbohydrate ABC transporter permease [Streptomyces flavofungini]|uniref:carbohydrate ABC transporter permease n=1 Tax=Streptomyces flavofungini TaxID=68200 RepID=UPI0034DFE88A
MSTSTTRPLPGSGPENSTPGAPAPQRLRALRRPGPRRGAPLRERLASGAFLAPAVLFVGVLLLAPFAVTIQRSLFDDRRVPGFAGLDNYTEFFTDENLVRSVENTLIWVAGTVLLPVVLGLAIACMTDATRWSRFARLCVVAPYALSGTAVAVVWNYMLTSDGALNQLLRAVGLGSLSRGWLLEWPGNTLVLILANAWQATGVAVILFLVGLQGIPPETLEAASLDGAGPWQRFRHVVLPQLRPVAIIVIGMSLANGLKSFDLIWVLTRGGPGRATETLAVSMYQETFLLQHPGAGAAIAVALTLIVLAASWLYLRRQLDAKGD